MLVTAVTLVTFSSFGQYLICFVQVDHLVPFVTIPFAVLLIGSILIRDHDAVALCPCIEHGRFETAILCDLVKRCRQYFNDAVWCFRWFKTTPYFSVALIRLKSRLVLLDLRYNWRQRRFARIYFGLCVCKVYQIVYGQRLARLEHTFSGELVRNV